MTSVADSVIFGNILSTSESAEIWSDTSKYLQTTHHLFAAERIWQGRTSYYLKFEASLAIAQARLGIIPQKASDAIVEKCEIGLIDWDEYRKQTELIGYVRILIRARTTLNN